MFVSRGRLGGTGIWRAIQTGRHGRARYAVALLLVAASLLLRFLLQPWLGDNAPYLLFFPAIMVAAWYGGLGPGVLATTTSALAAMYVFLPPAGLAIAGAADAISLAVFVAIGVGISWLNHQLRTADVAQRAAAALAGSRAERLDAIINTTVDGIIVIDSKGIIEAFNRGAQRLFGYPESEVMGRNVNMLMPSPDHEQHDGYLERYLRTGQARIIGTGREVIGRRRDGTDFPRHLSVGEMIVEGHGSSRACCTI